MSARPSLLGYPCKIFVREDNLSEAPRTLKSDFPKQSVAGDSIREFYESLIKETPKSNPQSVPKTNSNSKKARSKCRGAESSVSNYKAGDLLRLAQNNEFEVISRLICNNKDIDINETDSFGWSALMCASCSGAKEAVEVLLKHKADQNIHDKFGNNALKLAKRKNFFHIVSILEKYNAPSPQRLERKRNHSEKIFCEICNNSYHSDLKTHESSTLHLFNSGFKGTKTFYGIPDSNRGFQMLLRSGWNREKGLGLSESGIQFPIKVKKKTDRCGIGGIPVEEKDTATIDRTSQCKSLNQSLIDLKKEKHFERSFRLEFA